MMLNTLKYQTPLKFQKIKCYLHKTKIALAFSLNKTRQLKKAFACLKGSDFCLGILYQINEKIKDVFIGEDLQDWNHGY